MRTVICVLILVCILAAWAAWPQNRSVPPSVLPVQEYVWRAKGRGFYEYGSMQNGFFGISVEGHLLEMWTWRGSALRETMSVNLPRVQDFRPLPGNRYFATLSPGDPYTGWPLVISSLPSCDTIKTWPFPPGWDYNATGTSANGKFAAAILDHDLGNPPPGHDWDVAEIRVALIDVSTLELKYVAKLSGGIGRAGSGWTLAVSDDGKHVAVVAWRYGIALVDAQDKKVLWCVRSQEANSLDHAVFSPDGASVYAADGCGFVYKMATATGKVLRRWCATETGRPIYGHRITCIALSSDESWVAVGTGPEGLVFAWNTKSDEARPIVFPHGLITTTALSFSADSTHLASWAGGKIKVWKLPQ